MARPAGRPPRGPVCAGCHLMMDDIGLGLGLRRHRRFRTLDAGEEIRPPPFGPWNVKLRGAAELGELLAERPAACAASKQPLPSGGGHWRRKARRGPCFRARAVRLAASGTGIQGVLWRSPPATVPLPARRRKVTP